MFLIGKSELLMGDKLPGVGVSGCVVCVYVRARTLTQARVRALMWHNDVSMYLDFTQCAVMQN